MAARSGEMDSLVDQLKAGLKLDSEEIPAAVSTMEELVTNATPAEMEVLRRQLLLQQKLSRFNDVALVRSFLHAVQQQQQDAGDGSTLDENQTSYSYSCFYNQIMLPVVVEKNEQLPSDFIQNWWCIACPEGTRTLVMAAYNTTYVYDLEGNLICEHDTHLPGGSSAEVSKVGDPSECTILDCLYNDDQQTYHVMDVMCWAGYLMYKKETEFRLQYLTEKLKAVPSIKQVTQTNPFKFVMLPMSYVSNKQGICNVIRNARFELTGLLFYHKSAHYTPGVTPLGCWIEAYLIERLLNVSTVQMNFPKKGQRQNWRKTRYEESQHEEDSSVYVRHSAVAYRNTNNSARGKGGGNFHHGDRQQYHPASGYGGLYPGFGGYGGYGMYDDYPAVNMRGSYTYDYNYGNYQQRGGRQGFNYANQNQQGGRKKKGPQPQRVMLSIPVPDDIPNWDEPHEVMMSVVMEKIPERFAEDWLCVICPVAKRRTVVSCQGWTCSYNKLLALDRKFQSVLPGGNIRSLQMVRNQDMCILDCLHYKAERTFFVLDLMYWRNMPYYETEAEFRFSWIEMKLSESDAGTISHENEYKIRPMPRHQCTTETILAALQQVRFKVDGLLFFHKEGLYQIGSTPSVLWLEPKNMEGVLGFTPPDLIMPAPKKAAGAAATPATSTSTDSTSAAAPVVATT